ncbi:sensor histidine kinase [Flavobacterium muglaense]|uniref:histidine kinase n=1 Tax=Flavobacterium muglaense TaxID=2764716 RepID=A0A923N010_9FLAO|nr:HAMP domain-containing sensor histidine kinase [Flavobacterium muglaense]MBC5837710.1 HAMP domain-containing histidine kinase [Flavobacterium muglaense]MBC5844174.1 HAMP domain-containing histidine kinase [Flavobacterium muglaense]
MFVQKWNNLIGTKEGFSLEKRIFHGVCLITLLVLLICFPANFILGLDIFAYVLMVVFVLLLILFYFSRYSGHSKITFSIYVFFMSLVLVAGYIFNCGIDGPIILVFGITFLILAAIMERKQLLFWMLFQLSIVYVMLYLEFNHPDMVLIHYKERSFRFFDTALTLGVLMLTIYLTISYIKVNYQEQQVLSNKKNEELSKANASKNKLFSIISHDLRSPFNALIGLSRMLKENHDELDEVEKKEFVNAIFETSTQTYYLLQNLLEWSLSQTNEIHFSPEQINLKELVNNALAMPLEVAKSKEIQITTDIDASKFILVDKNMMETVVRNIVSNAIKFTGNEGEISITADYESSGITLKIADNGSGMSASTLGSLFANTSTATAKEVIQDQGMGLGLILCKDFVDRHKGKIWAESTKGVGTTFYIFIKS